MSEKHSKRYTSRFKFQVVMEALRGTKNIGQIAKMYGVHPITISHWKKEFSAARSYERNCFVSAIAASIFIPYADPNSHTKELCNIYY